MRSDKLQDAIGMVDADLVKRTEKTKERKPKWTAAVAAVLVLAVVAGIYFGKGSPIAMQVTALAKAEYPEMAPYPEGEWLPGFEEQYDAWRESKNELRAFYGAGAELEDFFTATIAEFLASEKNDNLVYSPLNVYMALAMLAETTEGESRAQILSLLGADSIEALRTQAHAVWNANYSDDGAVTSILASSLWLNENVTFQQSTLDTLAQNYYASSYQGTMGDANFTAAMQDWMNEQTGGLLEEYIGNIELTPDMIMALVTTIYFQAKWDNEFSPQNTYTRDFHAVSSDIPHDFMHKTEVHGIYFWGDKFGASRIRLKNSGNMWFLLPDEGVSVQELLTDEQALTFMCANGDWENQKSLRVNFAIPKFDVQSKTDLAKGLKNLGVVDCFSAESADFSPLVTEKQPIWLDKVEHGARVKIDEEGVTAAAYTAMLMAGAAMPPKDEIDFTLDRPFLFVITGSDGLPLFVGIVNQP